MLPPLKTGLSFVVITSCFHLEAFCISSPREFPLTNLASKCSIQIAYAIGVSEPLSLYVNTFDTGKVDDQVIEECIKKIVDLSPAGIRNKLKIYINKTK